MDTELNQIAERPTNGAATELVSNGHGETAPLTAQTQNNKANEYSPRQASVVCRIKEELNDRVCWKIRLWMVIIFILFLMIAVTMISLSLCTVIHEDVDDKFDSSLFKLPRHFNGSFLMPNMVLTEGIYNLSSNESQKLTKELQKKLTDVYSSSHALKRYFSKAEISDFRNGSVITDFWLKFLLPEEERESIRKFIVSREMVYNVLRQFLYDQDDDDEPLHVDPVSLTMFLQDG